MQVVVRAALVLALLLSVSTPAHARQAQRWYDAYAEGLRAVQRGDWVAAERLMLQAKKTGPQPGRRVPSSGDDYVPFFPDYYLGMAYLRTNRSAQAETSFQLVRKQNVITLRDPEYAAFERQSREATFNRAFAQARELAAAGNFDAVTVPLQEALATNIDNAKVQALSKETEMQRLAKAAPPPATSVATAPAPSQPADSTPVQTTPPLAANPSPSYQPPLTAGGASRPTPRVNIPTKTGNATVDKAGVIVPPRTPPELRNGILAFFSGDYGSAVQQLQNVAQQPGISPRAQVLLACAKVGMVLTGHADALMLAQTQSEFQSAALERFLTAADRRYISPRILQQLERR